MNYTLSVPRQGHGGGGGMQVECGPGCIEFRSSKVLPRGYEPQMVQTEMQVRIKDSISFSRFGILVGRDWGSFWI